MNLQPIPVLPPRPEGVPAPDRVVLGASHNRAELIDFTMLFGAVTIQMSNEEEGDLFPIWWVVPGTTLSGSEIQWDSSGRPLDTFPPGIAPVLETWFCEAYWVLRDDAVQAAHQRVEAVAQHFGYEPRPVTGTSV